MKTCLTRLRRKNLEKMFNVFEGYILNGKVCQNKRSNKFYTNFGMFMS